MSDFAGHTPGPWTYYEWRSGEYAIGAPGHHDLAEVNATDGADDVFPALANAALIAAAPTLLAQRDALAEALAAIIDDTCSYICPSRGRAGEPIGHNGRCNAARAALALLEAEK